MEEEIKKETVVETPKGLAAMRAKMMERNPDYDWDNTDDDGMADMAMADYDELSATVDSYKQRDAIFDDLAQKHPEGMMFLSQLAKGKSMREAIENSMEVSFDELYNDPDYPAMKEERANKEAEAVREMLEKLTAEAAENGWSEDDVDEALSAIDEFIQAIEGNAVTFEMLKLVKNGKNYDADVAAAKHEGEVDGRNAQIVETKRKKKASTDGVPVLGGKATGGDKTIVRGNRAGVGNGIWASGNIKRNEYK